MITNRDTDASQGYREGIGARGVTGSILMLEGPGAPLSLSGQLDQSLSFADVLTTLIQIESYGNIASLAKIGDLCGMEKGMVDKVC